MTPPAPLPASLLRRSAGPPVVFRPTPGPDVRTPTPQLPASKPPVGFPRRASRPLTRTAAWWLAASIPTVIAFATIIEPPPNGPEPVTPMWVNMLAGVTVLAALTAVVALVAVRRVGVYLAALTAAGLLALTVTCPMSEHHVVGPYTYVQLALSAGLLVASALMLATSGRAVTWAGETGR